MNNTKLIIVAVVVIAASVFFSYLLIPGVKTVIEKTTELVGGSGADFQTNWYRFGGVEHYAGSMTMKSATTTICAIQAPSATSTLMFGSASFVYASSTGATTIHMAKATTAYATTTALGLADIPSADSGTLVASSTPETSDPLDPATVFAPNEWFVVGLMGGVPVAANAPSGFCQAEWIVNRR